MNSGFDTDNILNRMSDAGDDIPVEAAVVEVAAEAPKGKLSVEDALQVGFFFLKNTRKSNSHS